jgi:hypothetical protein
MSWGVGQASILVLYFLTCLAVMGRFASRIHFLRRHRQRLRFGADDGFLVFSFICLTVDMALQLRYIDMLYFSEALALGMKDLYMPIDIISQALFMRKLFNTCNVLYWVSVSCVKFSILFFFRQLISRVRGPLMTYWWVVLLGCAALAVYGTVVPFMACPTYDIERSRKPPLLRCLFHLSIFSIFSLRPSSFRSISFDPISSSSPWNTFYYMLLLLSSSAH